MMSNMDCESLNEESITFGKYRGSNLSNVLKDRSYCKWLLNQEWFQSSYEYLYNRINEYKPREYFINRDEIITTDFISSYEFFNLRSEVDLPLTDNEKVCYKFYSDQIELLKQKILNSNSDNKFDIKAPRGWLKLFEDQTGMKREEFKEFLKSYDLPNIPYIVERIKSEGGIEYKGARSFLIAKENSIAQEDYWERILKAAYGEDIGAQFKFKNCIFDFINIPTNTIFECKLGLKDFNEVQHEKYKITLGEYRIIYLIGRDVVIDIHNRKVYSEKEVSISNNSNFLETLIVDYEFIQVEDICLIFGNLFL